MHMQVKNIRDLASVQGSGIKPGRVFRTGYLSKASPEDVSGLKGRGPTRELTAVCYLYVCV